MNDAPVISDESATTEIGEDTTTPIEGTLSITDVDDTVCRYRAFKWRWPIRHANLYGHRDRWWLVLCAG